MTITPPEDTDVAPDVGDQAPDVTVADESAPDKTARIAEENAGTTGTIYTVQAGRKVERDGVILEAGAVLQFNPTEVSAGVPATLIAAGDIA